MSLSLLGVSVSENSKWSVFQRDYQHPSRKFFSHDEIIYTESLETFLSSLV
jgi:hypothetical protein